MKKEMILIALFVILRLVIEPAVGFLIPFFLDAAAMVQVSNNDVFWFFYPISLNIICGAYPIFRFRNHVRENFGQLFVGLVSVISLVNLPIGLLFLAICLKTRNGSID